MEEEAQTMDGILELRDIWLTALLSAKYILV